VNELKKARMGMIAMLTVMLVSITRRLTGTRRLSSGMMTLALTGMVLLVVAGGASANGACIGDVSNMVFGPGDTVTESCTLNDTMVCTGSGLIVGAEGITIDGNNFGITGSGAAWSYGILNYNAGQFRGYHNVVIENLDISGFQEGICIQGTSTGPNTARVENNTIYNCTVHDNGANTGELNSGCGIHFYYNIWNSTIDNCKVYNTSATLQSSCDSPGAGIRLYSKSCYNNVTNCEIYGNALAGIYSKAGSKYNRIDNNKVYENAAPGAHISFPGGIRMQCKNTNWWTVSNNEVWDNYGPGIFVGGQNCTIYNNEVTGSKNCTAVGDGSRGDGIIIDRSDTAVGGTYNTLTHNKVCENAGYDIYMQAGKVGNTGDENTCYTSSNYHDEGMTTGCDYACIISCDASGNAKDEFAAGEKVYVKGGGYGISSGASYNLWIQDDPVSDGDTLASDPSGGQETVMPSGTPPSFGPIEIWDTAANPASLDEWDIVADKQNDGANTGKYNRASDGIDSSTIGTETMPGFVAPIPEVATFALVGLGLLGLVGYSRLGRRKN